MLQIWLVQRNCPKKPNIDRTSFELIRNSERLLQFEAQLQASAETSESQPSPDNS